MISTPYHFVPLSKHVVLPDWGNQVTQDIPFSDGRDGEFEIRLVAQSEIYVRNGHAGKQKDGAAQDTSFFQAPDGRWCIPATSIKGMFRNVLEIASFSRMRRISDRRYAIRDLKLDAYRSQFTEKDLRSKVRAGLLDISSDDWKIIPCQWASWRRSALDPDFGNRRCSASDKYLEFLRKNGTLEKRADVSFNAGGRMQDGTSVIPHHEAKFTPNGQSRGVLVFTGQPQDAPTEKKNVKRREFFFYDVRENDAFFVDDESTTYIDEEGVTVRRNQWDFKFIHEKQSAARDFSAWTSELDDVRQKYFRGRIPVFYILEGGRLRFGLAMMFRFAGEVSPREALRNTNPEHAPESEDFKPDMADLIFGYVSRGRSLRGRVAFSACFAEGEVSPVAEKKVTLGNPKPSFYPAYLKQADNLTDREQYKTFLDKDAELRGWKRYPALVRQKGGPVDTVPGEEHDDKTASYFRPLPRGTVFSGKVRYHNLREVELGALIWSIRLKTSKYSWHMLGMGKPYGMGKVAVEIIGMDDDEQKRLCKVFTDYILDQLKKYGVEIKDFTKIEQIEVLLDMAVNEEYYRTDWVFDYMTLDQYRACKGDKRNDRPPEVLGPYSVSRLQQTVTSPSTPQKKEVPASPNAEWIDKIKADRNNVAKVLKHLKNITSATPEEIAKIESALKGVNWFGSRWGQGGQVIKKLEELKKG